MLDVPIELMMSPVDQKQISWGAIADPPTYLPGPNEDAIKALVVLWKSAKRPIIIAEVIGRSRAKVNDFPQLLSSRLGVGGDVI